MPQCNYTKLYPVKQCIVDTIPTENTLTSRHYTLTATVLGKVFKFLFITSYKVMTKGGHDLRELWIPSRNHREEL